MVGINLQSNSKYEITFPAGVSITGSPVCTIASSFATISSCSYAGSLLTINVGAVTGSPDTTFTITNFVNPSTALDSWPATGGFAV